MIDITRPQDAPASLATGRYDGVDVIQALYEAFLGKCYLCETPIDPGTLDIDHRKPKAKDQFPELECAWTNLFPTCKKHGCNGRRERKYPEGGLLDPSANDRVEQRVHQSITSVMSNVLAGDVTCGFAAVHEDDVAARNTAIELDRIHHGTGSSERAQLSARALRKAIEKRIVKVASSVREFVTLPRHATERQDALKQQLRILFSRRAPYSALVRSCFSHRPEIRELFETP